VLPLAQLPVNPKDWSFLPATILAVAFLTGIGVWAATKLGLVKKNGNGGNGHSNGAVDSSGSKPPSFWELKFDEIVEKRVAPTRTMLHTVIAEQLAARVRDELILRALERVEARVEDGRLK
jgi:hypothetical protein